ncbi:hypothetical protein GCM10009020_10960 [Natronoarchaeum mannanilyticum]|uniref:Uncharacterized protein n=1 Tax=Natronoarchaeum mannanilyticum TaxID=926360 RepID=A0AAV3T857_9EURY
MRETTDPTTILLTLDGGTPIRDRERCLPSAFPQSAARCVRERASERILYLDPLAPRVMVAALHTAVLGAVLAALVVLLPAGLYVWLRYRGTLGELSGRAQQ